MFPFNTQTESALQFISKTQKAYEAALGFISKWYPRVSHVLKVTWGISLFVFFTTISGVLMAIAEGLDLLVAALETQGEPEYIEIEESQDLSGTPEPIEPEGIQSEPIELQGIPSQAALESYVYETVELSYRDLQRSLKAIGESAKGTKLELQARWEACQNHSAPKGAQETLWTPTNPDELF